MPFTFHFKKSILGTQAYKAFPKVSVYLFLSLVFANHIVMAEVYKTVDANGNTSYSDMPPNSQTKETSTVDIEPDMNVTDSKEKIVGTHADWLKQAQQKRAKDKLDKAEQKQQERQAYSEWHTNYKAAKAALQEAKQKLQAGVIISEGDFIGRAGGGVRPSEQYFDKQQALEQAVEKAKENLKKINKAKPH